MPSVHHFMGIKRATSAVSFANEAFLAFAHKTQAHIARAVLQTRSSSEEALKILAKYQ